VNLVTYDSVPGEYPRRLSSHLDVGFPQAAAEEGTKPAQASSQHTKPSTGLTVRVAIKVKGRIRFIELADVAAIEAAGNYVIFRHKSCSYMVRESIAVAEEKLAPYGFVRIHRSVLVNYVEVQEIQPLSTGEYVLRISSGKEYTVSRTYKRNLRCLATAWVGWALF
jgi:two-component system LytT family response regulator